MADEIPVACCLSDEELRNREATLLAEFRSALVTTEELSDGYLFRIPGDKQFCRCAGLCCSLQCNFQRCQIIRALH